MESKEDLSLLNHSFSFVSKMLSVLKMHCLVTQNLNKKYWQIHESLNLNMNFNISIVLMSKTYFVEPFFFLPKCDVIFCNPFSQCKEKTNTWYLLTYLFFRALNVLHYSTFYLWELIGEMFFSIIQNKVLLLFY